MKTLRVIFAVIVVITLFGVRSDASTHEVAILGGTSGSFSPKNIEINEGDVIRWTNSGSSQHNTRSGTSGNLNGLWSSSNLGQGATFSHTFNSDGTFPYLCTLHGFTGQVKVIAISGVFDDPSTEDNLPNLVALRQNSPNPFNASTQMDYSLDRDTQVQLSVYNILGQRVATLVEGFQTGGLHTVVWDGRDESGNATPSGIYFARMVTTDVMMTRKMVLLR